MSQENAKTVRDAVEALNDRDIGAFVACLHPEVEWQETAGAFPGLSGGYHGRGEVERWAEQAVVDYWAKPTKAAIEVATPVIARTPLGTSSM